jgi:hypothetical protein
MIQPNQMKEPQMGKLAIGFAGALISCRSPLPRRRKRKVLVRSGTSAKRHHHPQDRRLRRFRPLVPARHAPRLRPRPLLVRALLVSG